MFWRRKRDDEPTIRLLDTVVRYFIVQAHGQNFRHDRAGWVGFYTARAICAPHEDNALAQMRAIVPVQLLPYGTTDENFVLEVTIVRETTMKASKRVPTNGFMFYSEAAEDL